MSQIRARFFFGTARTDAGTATVLKGNGASKGEARGRARVVRGLDESDALQPGEILGCRATSPPWTPLFAVAAAVVTETGGVLSHSAICAREYAIPCVVGLQGAMAKIPEGALISVDGTRGTVTIGEPQAAYNL